MENVKNDSNIYPSFSLAFFFTDFRGLVRGVSPILARTPLHHPFPPKAPAMQATYVHKVRGMSERKFCLHTALNRTFTISKVNLNLQYFCLIEIWKSEV